MNHLRILFMGTPEFAAHHLKVLHERGAHIVAVITAPDKPAGRGQKLKPSAVKEMALELSIPVMQPEKLKNPDFLEELKSYRPDLQIVVAFRMLPEVVWNLPPKGTFNLHASLLPQYRGAAPINWAVINGEKETGVTTFFLNHDIDTGNIIMQEKVAIAPNDNAGDVHDRLMEAGAVLVVKTVEAIAANTVQEIPQNTNESTLLKPAPKIFKEDGRLDWNQSAASIHNKIRGLSPFPGAWTELIEPGKEAIALKIFSTSLLDEIETLQPGAVYCDHKSVLKVGTKDRPLLIHELQLAGKKRMKTEDFLRGYKWQPEAYFK
ncbi:methionyl-tRNA formyltransferase [Geofilum rubicundum]|uniref:Methionyl-tRNA formyltransferase n=1 Tax=Geofilum rubicundum JCM 15548 TaxID=1236989 RepID=A0A0E9LYL3_9BACT|nr:methionyl-tRNA formyltransferase [Geofilum rubicundum]GAO30354.1 methionyl-tRNA formyltransferase [Geofilum rubicundum JCM 15548]